MSELGFLEKTFVRSGYGARDASPDSVIFTLESNFSLSSSVSASVDRCSFASDVHDHDSLASELSLHLDGHEGGDEIENLSGPDPDPNKATTVHKRSRFSRKGEKVKDCQDGRIRSDALLKNPDRRKPASLDLNNVSASSPRLGTMKKSTVPTRKLGAFPSSGSPNYHHHHQSTAGMQKGWSSERLPLHNNVERRQGNSSGVLPFKNGKTLPSKWEDAERWIFSTVSGDAGVKQSIKAPQRRPKSKSGPLGPPRIPYHSLYSPAIHMCDGEHTGNFMAVSPFSAGVIATDGLTIHSRSRAGGLAVQTEPCMARSVSVRGYSEVVNPPLLPSQDADENLDAIKDAVFDISHTVSRRDVATQMSPQDSTHSSPKGRPFSPSTLCIMELQSIHSSKSEVRDVQVDERVNVTRWLKKYRARNTRKSAEIVDDDWRKRAGDTPTATWDVTETAKNISKVKREEAKITEWENLQKAKAEAALRKLEMKLEKKRSSSMEKIMNKLRSAQNRAQEMRSSMLANQAHQVTRSSHKAIAFHRTCLMGSLSGCFTCHAF